ncbi:hypothetical protein ACVWWG_005399 [Bradyrhizobium sp. LB7.2]
MVKGDQLGDAGGFLAAFDLDRETIGFPKRHDGNPLRAEKA